MMMTNNPIVQIVNLMRSGGNPNVLLQQLARTDPQINKVLQMTRGKSDAEMRQFAENLARERGIDLENLARSLGITIPSSR